MEKKLFGYTYDNKEVYSYVIKRGNLEAEILNFGGIIRKLIYKGTDVVLGFDSVKDYEDNHTYFGALIGRYANRINSGKFYLNGKEYQLSCNNGLNHLHGGSCGFDRKIWDVTAHDDKLILTYLSKDGEEGYPGNLKVMAEYIIEDDSLIINYNAESDKDTVCNLTNHSYFNLNGHNKGDILKHTLKLNCSHYTPVNTSLIPTGEIKGVKGTEYDFTVERKICEEGASSPCFKDYDINFCIDKGSLCAELSNGGITMEVYTDKPGIQLFSGSNTENLKGKDDCCYPKYAGLCLETQFYPDSINQSCFPSPVLKAGEIYKYKTVYKFI